MCLVAVVVITSYFVAFASIVVPNTPKATHLSFICAATTAVVVVVVVVIAPLCFALPLAMYALYPRWCFGYYLSFFFVLLL